MTRVPEPTAVVICSDFDRIRTTDHQFLLIRMLIMNNQMSLYGLFIIHIHQITPLLNFSKEQRSITNESTSILVARFFDQFIKIIGELAVSAKGKNLTHNPMRMIFINNNFELYNY